MKRQHRVVAIASAAAAAGSTSANANVGLPMVALFLPPLWAALIPIILVEAVIVSRFAGRAFLSSLGAVTLANVASTVVGVPCVWFALAVIELACCGTALGVANIWTKLYAVTVQAPWLIPYESEFGWMIPLALLTLAALFAAFSILVETPIISRMLGTGTRRLWRGAILANATSYVLLGIVGWVAASSQWKLDPLFEVFRPMSAALAEGVFAVGGWLVK